MVSFVRVADGPLYVPNDFEKTPREARLGLVADDASAGAIDWPEARKRAIVVFWPGTVDWDRLLVGLPDLLAALPGGAARFAWLGSDGSRFRDVAVPTSGRLAEPFRLDWAGATYATIFGGGSRVEATDTGIVFEPVEDLHIVTFPEERPTPGFDPRDWRLNIDGPITVSLVGPERGCLDFALDVDEERLEALGAQVRFFAAGELLVDDQGVESAQLTGARFPLLRVPAGGALLRLAASIDPADSFDIARSAFALSTKVDVSSHFETVLGHPVALSPLEGARFVLDRSVSVVDRRARPLFERTYLTPDGPFELVVDESADEDWPERHSLVLGTSTSEYVTFRPRRDGAPGDRVVFHARRPATDRASLPPGAAGAGLAEPVGAERLLADVATTSWISFAPGSPGLVDDGPALVSQPAELELFADEPSAGLVATPRTMLFDPRPRAEAAREPMPIAPFLGVASLTDAVSVDADVSMAREMEAQLVALARKEQTRPRGGGPAGLAPEERATPHGFPVTLEGDRWQRVVLGKTPPGSPDFGFHDMEEPATRALSGNRTFLVATRLGPGLAELADKLEIAGWSFVSDIDMGGIQGGQTSEPKDGHDLLPTFVFKYHDLSVFDLLGLDATTGEPKPNHQDQDNWTAAEDFNAEWTTVREQLKVYLRKTVERHRSLGEKSPYGLFLERLRNPAWNGLLMLNTAIVPASLPLQVQGLLAGIDMKYFRGHHVGLDLNQLGQQGFDIERSAFFGVVDYPQPAIPNPQPLDPNREPEPDDPEGWSRVADVEREGRVANFQVEYLRIQFENSEVRRFDCRVKLWLARLFRDDVGGLSDGDDPIITFDGQYERRRDASGTEIETYTFVHEDDHVVVIDTAMLDRLTISRLQMTTVEADDRRVLSRFSFWGDLSFQDVGDFDLFGIDKITFGDLGIDLDFDLGERIKRFLPRLGSIRFDLPSGGRRGGSFLGKLPFKLKFFQFGDGLSLDGLGYFKFDTPNFGGDLFDFALGFDIDLGSLGSLAKKLEGLRLETLFGWRPESAGGEYAIGFKLRGTGGGPLDLGIEGVLKLVIQKLKIEDFDHGGTKHFAIQAVNTRLTVIDRPFPGEDSELKLFLFVDPARLVEGSVSEMGWLGVLTDSSGGDGFELPLLALGQRVDAFPKGGVPTTRQVTDHIASLGRTDDTGELVSILTGGDLNYAPEREWTVAVRTILWELAALDLVFLDPDLYGIRLRVPGPADQQQLFAIDILYRKLTDDLGVYSIELAVPDAWRQLEFGGMSLTLPIIGLDLYTNGDFQVDVGFPWAMDFSRSCTVQMLPFLGGGGFYYAQLESASSSLVPVPRNPAFTYDPVVQLGFGARVGLGKEFSKGPLRAGLSVSVFGILEGAWGQLRQLPERVDDQDGENLPTDYPGHYLVVAGTVGILGEVFGHVDFGIVKASVSIRVWIAFGWVLETYQPLLLSVEAGVRVRVKVVIGRIKVFGKTIKITITFSFSTRLRFEWTLGKGDLARWDRLFLPPAAGLAAAALQPDLGPVRCLDWIDAPTVFDAPREIPLRFAPDVTVVDGAPHTVSLLTIEPEHLRLLGRALVLWAGERWAADGPVPVDGERPFSIHDLRHLEACLACPRSLARGETGPGDDTFAPLDATRLRELFGANLRFRVVAAEEVPDGEEGPRVAVFPFLSHLTLSYRKDGGETEVVRLSERRASRAYLDRLDAGFETLRILLEERDSGTGLADEEDAAPFADFLLEDYCHLLLRQAVDALEGLLAETASVDDPTTVGTPVTLTKLLDRLDAVDAAGDAEGAIGWRQIGEATSRFYLHGLRVPAFADDHADDELALFEAAGVQRQVPAGGQRYRVAVEQPEPLAWLRVDPDVGEDVEMAALSQLPTIVPARLQQLEARSPVRPRARRYPLQARAGWAHGAERRTLWNLPRALRDDLRQQPRGLHLYEGRPGALDGSAETDPLPGRWATRLALRVQRLEAGTQGAGDRPVYRLLPLGEAERRRLDRLVEAPEWLGRTEPRIVFRGASGGASGGASDAVSHRWTRVALWRTDLSTEPAPEGAGLTGTASDDLLVRAGLDEVAAFLVLLRRASLVRSTGYFLAYRGGDDALEPGLPAELFDADGKAELSLLLLHPVAGLADPVSPFADSVVLGSDVGDRGHGGAGEDDPNGPAGAERTIVYARVAAPSLDLDFDFDLPFAPGTVGFRAYRQHPDALPTEAERAVAEQYHLLEYEIFAARRDGDTVVVGDRLHALNEVLPVAPREIGEEGPGDEPRHRPGDLAADDWCYEHIVPAHKLLHGRDASPYSAVGETLRVALRFRDPYGNRLANDEAVETIDLDVGYIDRLLSPTDWPSVVSTWDVAADGSGRIEVQLRFDPRGFYADRSAEESADWTWLTAEDERIVDVRRCYTTVRQQLADTRTTMRLAVSFHAGRDHALDAADREALIALVDEILDFLDGLPESGRELPTDQHVEPPGRRWTKTLGITPGASDFEELRVAFHLARPAELVDPRIAGRVPEVAAVEAPIEAAVAATALDGEAEPGAGLVAFAERFEAAFGTLALAVGTGSADRRALWAVRRSLVTLDFTGEEPAFFAVPPLSTRLVSGDVQVPGYPDVRLSGGAVRVADVDLDLQLRETFADVERFLAPALADRLLDASAGDAVDRVIRAKDAAAELLAPKLRSVYRDSPDLGDQRALDLLKERMRTDLREGYDVDTLVVVPMRVAEGATTSGRPPVIYGRLADAPAPTGDGEPPPAEARRLSAANLPLVGGDGRSHLVFALDSKRETRQELESLRGVTYRPTHVERRIDQATADRDTAWLQLVRAEQFAEPLPVIDVPVPLRRFPEPPRLEEHVGTGDAITDGAFATRLADARRWAYEVTFHHPFVDQDTAYLEVLYNVVPKPSNGGVAPSALASAEVPDPLSALASYHHHRDALWKRFDELSAGAATGESARLASIYADLVEGVVRSLRPSLGLAGDLVEQREEYRIDDDLLDPARPDGRRELEVERTVDAFGGVYEVLPRRADGAPYAVRDEPARPGVDHRIVSYQPDPGEARFRPLARLSRLDVLHAESAWAGLLLRRNENFGDRLAADAFVYETPAVRFGESFTPTLDRHEPLVVDGPAALLGDHVESILGTIVAGVIPKAGDPALSRPLRVDMRWSYESGVLAAALGEPTLDARPPHPIAILPAYALASRADVTDLAAAATAALDTWRARHRPIAGAHFVADVRVYGRNVEKPVLRLRRIAIPVSSIT